MPVAPMGQSTLRIMRGSSMISSRGGEPMVPTWSVWYSPTECGLNEMEKVRAHFAQRLPAHAPHVRELQAGLKVLAHMVHDLAVSSDTFCMRFDGSPM